MGFRSTRRSKRLSRCGQPHPRPAPDRHLEVRVARLQVVLRRDQRAVAEPLGDHVGGQRLGPVGGAAGAHVVEEARPGLVSVNSIVQGAQAGQLWPLVFGRFGLSIAFAHQPFKWFADTARSANVHVVIVGLVPAIPSNLVKFIEGVSLADFALLTSAMHMAWLRTVGGRLEGRLRYSIGVVYNAFPMLRGRDDARLAPLGQRIVEVRDRLHASGCSLADMYDAGVMPSDLQKAHQLVDEEVDRQYLGHAARDDSERVVHLLNAYRDLRGA